MRTDHWSPGSRSSWLASYIALLFFGFISRRRWLTISLLAIGGLLGIALSYSVTSGGLDALLRLGRGLALRPLLWGIAWHVFMAHPIFGVGFGGIAFFFKSYYPTQALSIYDFVSPAAANPHNLYLQIGAETGLPGLLLLLWFFIALLKEMRRTLKKVQDAYYRSLLTAFLATLPAIFVHAFFERSAVLGAGSYTIFFWLSVAIFQSIKRMGTMDSVPFRKD